MAIVTVAALLFISYYCTCRLGLSQSGFGPTLNVITANEVLVVATGVNSLHVAWWTSDATVVMRYTVSCSSLKANLKVEQSVEQFTDSAINFLSVDNLVPQTTYNCCIAEYGIDNSNSAVCKTATTLPVAGDCQQGNSSSLNPVVGAAISLFVMLVITLLCTLALFMIAVRQSQNGRRIQKWLKMVKDRYRLESHSLDNCYDNIMKGSEHNEPDTVYCTAADTVSIMEQEFPSDHSINIKTTDCIAYGTNEPEDSNESDARNSEIYEAIS